VNLNRDACGWFDGPRPYPPDGPAGGIAADVWVRHGDGRDAAAHDYFRHQAVPTLRDVQRGTLWRLLLPTGDAAEARRLAEDVAVARSRHHGLLANPQSQTAVVLHLLHGPDGKENR
jgi:hypothetical protein